jgi:ribbon-helix-helix CopG family protein
MLCCMGATRTQIYLSEEQRSRIDAVAAADGVTMAEVVRRALTAYLDRAAPDAAPALAATFGAAGGADVPSRDEWDRG